MDPRSTITDHKFNDRRRWISGADREAEERGRGEGRRVGSAQRLLRVEDGGNQEGGGGDEGTAVAARRATGSREFFHIPWVLQKMEHET